MIALELSKMLYGLTPDDTVRVRAKELMLDSIGTAFAASQSNVADELMKSMAFGDSVEGISPSHFVWGRVEKLGLKRSMMSNAALAHMLDFDDTHTHAISHSSAVLAPLCLGLGFKFNKSECEVIDAFVKGWQISAMLGVASRGHFHANGFHTTPIVSAVGASFSAGLLFGLDQSALARAMCFSTSFVGGINEFLSGNADTKPLHIANALNIGLNSAIYAKSGLKAPPLAFEGRDGLFRAFAREASLANGIEFTGWEVLNVSIKPYPVCHFAHGFIDCAIKLKGLGVRADEIERVVCFLGDVRANFIANPLMSKQCPKTSYEAKFALPFLFALAFFDGDVNLRNLESLNKAELLEFSSKVECKIDDDNGFPKYFGGRILVTLKNGNEISIEQKINLGNPENPLTSSKVMEKFKNNIAYAKKAIDIDKITNLNLYELFRL